MPKNPNRSSLSPAEKPVRLVSPLAVPRPQRSAVEEMLEGEPFSSHKILNHFDRIKAVAAGESVSPITVEIDPSNLCNHTCQWCVSSLSHNGDMLSFEQFDALIDQLQSMDVKSVVLKGGGEPSVHPRFVELLERLAEAGLGVGLITNGSFPRAEFIESVLRNIDWVRVSLDAACSETHAAIHGSRDFDRVIRNVQALAEGATRTLVGLNFVAESRNYSEIEPFARMGRHLGVAYVSIRCVFDLEEPLPEAIRVEMVSQARAAKAHEEESYRVFLGNFTDRYINGSSMETFPFERCLGPNLVGVEGAGGETYACCFLRGNRDFSFGNVNEQSFEEIWNGPKRREVMAAVDRGECGHVCLGGMTANRYTLYNEILNYLALENREHATFA